MVGHPSVFERGTLTADSGYEGIRRHFAWQIPDHFNIGTACSQDQDPDSTALVSIDQDSTRRVYSFGEITDLSNRLANGLKARGVRPGDRVGVVIPQSLHTAVACLAIFKIGALVLPLSSLFGPDGLALRLRDADVTAVLATPTNMAKVVEAYGGSDLPTLVVSGENGRDPSLDDLMTSSRSALDPARTSSDDPALLIYTSGTTGNPKGALHAHRCLLGHLPSFELLYELAPQPGDVHWTPADWAWIGGLMDSLLPAWYYGSTVVTDARDFDPTRAVDLMESESVTCAFLPPTALKMMRAAGANSQHLALRAVFTGGEPLGEEVLHWGRSALGSAINEGYGQTEANLVTGNSSTLWPIRPGSMGRPMPGHQVQVVAPDGSRLVGEAGEIAVRSPDPVMMLGYWRNPEATGNKIASGWLLTGDLGIEDEDGHFWFMSRTDDVITSMGYRIGPSEIEDSLLGHPAVASCAVVGKPDKLRGEVPVAYVVLKPGRGESGGIVESLQAHVRERLAAHEVPRHIAILDELPQTTTGKTLRRTLRERAADDFA